MVFVPAVTQCPGGRAGSRQRSSEFRQFLRVRNAVLEGGRRFGAGQRL